MNMNTHKTNLLAFTEADISRIIEMAWEDRTPFEAIESGFGIAESAVILIMRRQLKSRSFRLWRARTQSQNETSCAARSRREPWLLPNGI